MRSETCKHPDRRIESTEDWPTSPLDNPCEYDIYVCNVCGYTIPLDEADPALDAFEAKVDEEIDYARGK